MTYGTSRSRRARRAIAGVAAVAALLTGCLQKRGGAFEQEAKKVQRATPDKRPWFCNSVGQGTPPSGHGNGHHVHPFYEGKTKGPLSWADCTKLAGQLDQTLKATKGLETRAKAEKAGWRAVADYVPGLGTHHVGGIPGMPAGGMTGGSIPTNPEFERIGQCLRDKGVDLTGGFPNMADPQVSEALKACGVPLPSGGMGTGGGMGMGMAFDPAKPPVLIYGGKGPDAPLVGVAYVFMGGPTPPEAYAGGNDWWHLHTQVCFGLDPVEHPDVDDLTEAECAALGGRFQKLFPAADGSAGGGVWLLHVWPFKPYEYAPDLFVSGHPCMGLDAALPQSDPCWADAHRDPGASPPTPTPTTTAPGPEHGDHGDH
jgi:hypothetical protein